jgi:hypothetical protein
VPSQLSLCFSDFSFPTNPLFFRFKLPYDEYIFPPEKLWDVGWQYGDNLQNNNPCIGRPVFDVLIGDIMA